MSGAVRAVMGALDGIYGTERRRSAFERYTLSIVLAIAVGLLLVLAFSIVRFVPIVLDDANGLLAAGEFLLRWGIAAGLLALAVGLLVHYAPEVNRPLPWVTFGAGLVIAGWVGMSIGFGVYLTEVADYDSIFGHLATVIVLMAYLYAAAVVFVAGAQIDACVRSGVGRRQRLMSRTVSFTGAMPTYCHGGKKGAKAPGFSYSSSPVGASAAARAATRPSGSRSRSSRGRGPSGRGGGGGGAPGLSRMMRKRRTPSMIRSRVFRRSSSSGSALNCHSR